MKHIGFIILLTLLVGCEGRTPSFSLLPTANTFLQSGDDFNNKIDILWVIDNSGSMHSSQVNVADNFNFFIQDFITKNYDYNIAVITSEAYLATIDDEPEMSKFRDGTDATSHTGYFVIDNQTPEIENNFLINIMQGIAGDGDERAFSSFKDALNNSLNAGFLREDSFLAIINVSDEDDFSHDGSEFKGKQYDYEGLHTIQSYVDYLDELTASSGATRRYSFNSIHVVTQECDDELPFPYKGIRYSELVAATGGVEGDICGNFATTLEDISKNIIQLSTQFFLDREPILDTIVVLINGETVPQSELNGWSYNEAANSILFHGSYVPQQGATISINFDPATFNEG
ncbi:MAG: hypothetical protein HOO06_06765 [Bdellovibrionaceae bacterium]|jgi:hypothetical protein|nr:hypothetical protein [Pseudobdellovibrionaceae bacterium]